MVVSPEERFSRDLAHLGLDARKPLFGPRDCKQKRRRPDSAVISVFVIGLVESIISKLARREIAIFYVVSIAEQTGLGMTWLETSKTWPIYSKTCVKRPL